VTLTGGCSKNDGLAHALAKKLDIEIKKLPHDPQIAGALGAAIFAAERLETRANE
jgi:activator of 2-hydroxyglutaryl-CoA dehydratase